MNMKSTIIDITPKPPLLHRILMNQWTGILTIAALLAALFLYHYTAHAQNPVIGTIEGRPITLDTIQDGQLYRMRFELHRVFRERMQGYALAELAKTRPEYALSPVTVTDQELEGAYSLAASTSPTPADQLKPRLRAFLAAHKAHEQLERLWANAIAAGLVTDTLVPPGAYTPSLSFDPARVQGNPSAPVLLVEYSDYQCPFCRQAKPTVEQVLATYKDRVAYLLVHYPLDMHPGAFGAAVASECARDQHAFQRYGDQLFAQDPQTLGPSTYLSLATSDRLDMPHFTGCLADPKTHARVNADRDSGRILGVTGTPSFLIGPWDHASNSVAGTFITGAVDAGTLAAALDKQLH